MQQSGYTTDGTEPNISSPVFPSSLLISALTTIRAKAYKSGMIESVTTIATYNIGIVPPVPEIYPLSGTYAQNLETTISWQQGLSCFMNWTNDGSEPYDPSIPGHQYPIINNPTTYTWPFIQTIKMKARTYLNGTWSSLVEREYIIVQAVFIKQLDATLNSFGQAAYWDITQWESVDPDGGLVLELNENHFLSSQEFIPSSYEKFNYWEDNLPETNNWYRNWDTLTITENTTDVYSYFLPTYNGIIVKNNLEATGINGGSVEFKDPWLIDIDEQPYGLRSRGLDAPFKQRSSPFYPDYTTNYNGDVYKGVFLNQDPTLTPTYYSVGALDEQPINLGGGLGTHKFYFQNWTGTDVNFQDANANQTGVVFTGSNAVVTANLKGNLLSNSPGGLSTNSQRKIVRTDNGYYHLVYESLGNVYYTHSLTTDFYGDWTREELLMTKATNPSLDYVGNDVYIVYEIYDTDYSNQPVVHLLKLLYDNGTWFLGWYTDVAYNELSNLGNAKPVVYARSDEVFVIAKLSVNEGLKYTYIIDPENSSSQWSTPADLLGTDKYSVNPTLAGRKLYSDDDLHISYESNNRIYYLFSYRAANERRFYTLDDISSGSSYSINKYPSISLVNNQFYPIITWRGAYKTIVAEERMGKENAWMIWIYKTVVRVKSSLGWGTFSAFGNKVDYPNINSIETNDETIIAWSENQGQYAKYVKRAGSLQANTTFKQ